MWVNPILEMPEIYKHPSNILLYVMELHIRIMCLCRSHIKCCHVLVRFVGERGKCAGIHWVWPALR